MLLAFPWIERRITGDTRRHNVLQRPREAPGRTAFGTAFALWVFLIFVAGSADRVTVFLGLPYVSQIWFYRVAVWVLPVVAFFVVRRWCRALMSAETVAATQEAAEQEAARDPAGMP